MQNKTRGYGSYFCLPRKFVFQVHDSNKLFILQLPILENIVVGQKDMEMKSGEDIKVSLKGKKQGLVAVKKCGVYFHVVEVYEGDTTMDQEEVFKSDNTTIDDDKASQSYGISKGEVSGDDTIGDDDEVSKGEC